MNYKKLSAYEYAELWAKLRRTALDLVANCEKRQDPPEAYNQVDDLQSFITQLRRHFVAVTIQK